MVATSHAEPAGISSPHGAWHVMRDGSTAIGIHADELRLADDAIAEIGAKECAPEWEDGLLHGRLTETVAKMRAYAQFSAATKTVRCPICPGQREEIALDFKAEIDGVECWFEAVMIDNALWWLSNNDRSTMFHSTGAIGRSVWRILARNLVAAASRRVGRLEGWEAQTVMIASDPLGEIGHCTGINGTRQGARGAWTCVSAARSSDRRKEWQVHDTRDCRLGQPALGECSRRHTAHK